MQHAHKILKSNDLSETYFVFYKNRKKFAAKYKN